MASKQQWRDADKKFPMHDLPSLSLKTTEPVRTLLKERFEALVYKGQSVSVGTPANENDIKTMEIALTRILDQSTINKLNGVSKAEVLADKKFSTFFEEHVRTTHYSITIKKCVSEGCPFHEVLHSTTEVFNEVAFLPAPKLKTEDKFYSFEELYGKEPDESDRPGATKKKEHDICKPDFPLQVSKARIITICTECSFPRLLYTRKKLTTSEMMKVETFLDSNLYTCGAEVPLTFQPSRIDCNDPISLHYFQVGNKLKGFILLCRFCCTENCTINEQYKYAICKQCEKKINK